MFRSLHRAVVLAIAIGFTMAPLVLAQTSGTGSTGSMEQSRPTTETTEQTGTGTMGMSTMDAQDTMHATIADVNHQKNTVKLRMQGGETVELKLPEQSLMNLNKGDSVQVSIRKADTSSMPQAYPGSSPPSSGAPGAGTSGSGTRPR
jgi:FlaG/FlaF family flagellin (archaellin)